MKNIICSECNTENEPQYKYCKNCGKQLVSEENVNSDEKRTEYNQPVNNTQGKTYYGKKVIVDNIGTIPTEDVEAYVGKKSYEIIPKLSKMELTGSKISWCWPTAILGYLFGPLGAAIWFFYRKMYKVALILLAIGLVLTAGINFISGDIAAIEENLTAMIEAENFNIQDFAGFLSSEQTTRAVVAGFVENVANIATMVFCGLFSYNIYKNFIIDKISQYKARAVDPRYYQMGLSATGGTSAGMAFLGVILMSFTEEVCAIIAALVF